VERCPNRPRENWQAIVESQGLYYHTIDGQAYWNESAFYRFSAAEIDEIEKATYALDKMCLESVEHVIRDQLLSQFGIAPAYEDLVRASWEHDEQSIYGRFDLAYGAGEPPKLLEYNADTPTALLEAAVTQWFWLKDTHPQADQFNSIHERLIEVWKVIKSQGPAKGYFSAVRGHLEDYMTVNYLRDTAIQGGLETEFIHIEDIGWNERLRAFVDLHEKPMETIFKLYPWEWLLRDKFAPCLLKAKTRWLEPAWKVILSNKLILKVLWDLFPNSPYLLRTSAQPWSQTYIKKPTQGREGDNITLVVDGQNVLATEGPYSDGPFVFQEVKPLPKLDGNYAVLGSWLVNGYACGVGIREDQSPVTQNTSRFVPHLFDK
jgi:glutathionylspermidine synthase